jgi:carbon monoxide dehydrogenase subunit G
MAQANDNHCGGALKVRSSHLAGEVRVEVALNTQAKPAVVWDVMTDYANATRFIKHLKRSDAIATGLNTVRVVQVGRASWGPFAADVATDYEVTLQPAAFKLQGRLIQGDVKDMWLEAALTATSHGTELRYVNRIRPAVWMPMALAEPLLAQRARESFEDLQAEISRRAGHCSSEAPNGTP